MSAAPVSPSGVAVVTIVHGRHDHLRAQHASLLRQTRRPDQWVVVAMDDPALTDWRPADLPPDLVALSADPGGLPLARARNAGASRARELGCDVLVFLDVDCLAAPDLVGAYAEAVASTPGDPGGRGQVWCGPVTYLPPSPSDGYDLDDLPDDPHPARPAPAPGRRQAAGPTDWHLFWSLSFALGAADLERTGGFCEDYVGYGGEDTDFAQRAREAGLGLTWLGSARAHHQHHPVSRPPVEHAADIVRNAGLFHRRWGWWPMGGWLAELAESGVVRRDTDGTWSLV